jgi:hypothetical protein
MIFEGSKQRFAVNAVHRRCDFSDNWRKFDPDALTRSQRNFSKNPELN